MTVSAEIQRLFRADIRRKNFRVHFPNGEYRDLTNEDIVQESVSFTESVCSQQYLKFGLTEASQISFECVGVPNILGSKIECYEEISVDGFDNPEANADAEAALYEEEKLQPEGFTYAGVGILYGAENLAQFAEAETMTLYDDESASSENGYLLTTTRIIPYSSDSRHVQIGVDNTRAIYTFDDFVAGTLLVDFENDNAWHLVSKDTSGEIVYQNCEIATDAYITDVSPFGYLISKDEYYNLNRSIQYMIDEDAKRVYYDRLSSNHDGYPVFYSYYSYTDSYTEFEEAQGVTFIFESLFHEYVFSRVKAHKYPDYPWYRIKYGTFYVNSCPRSHGNMLHRRVVAFTYNFRDYMLSGIHPNSAQTLYPPALFKMLNARQENMIELTPYTVPYYDGSGETGKWTNQFAKTGYQSASSSYYLDIGYGEGKNSIFFQEFRLPILCGGGDYDADDDKGVRRKLGGGTHKPIINVHFKKDTMDDYANKVLNGLVANIPSGNYYYDSYDGYQTRQFKSGASSYGVTSGLFRPSYYITYYYRTTDSYEHFCLPHTIEPDTNYLIDFRNEIPAYEKEINIADVQWYVIHIMVPYRYIRSDDNKWAWVRTNGSSDTAYTAFEIKGVNMATHDREGYGDMKVYFAEYIGVDDSPYTDLASGEVVTDESAIPSAKIKNTDNPLKNACGKYYTYENAFDAQNLINGYLELIGAFGAPDRDTGLVKLQKLSKANPYTLEKSDYYSFWWDEYDIRPLGTIKYKYTKKGNEQIGTYKFGDGLSEYDMTDNMLLSSIGDKKPEEIEAILDEWFIPNVQDIAFIPADLGMRGLPFLETGDYLNVVIDSGDKELYPGYVEIAGVSCTVYPGEITDGENTYTLYPGIIETDGLSVGTYILNRTLDGIQSLSDTIASTGGEVVSVG